MSVPNSNSLSHIDQMGREIKIKNTPKRIISLVPSQTELLYDLGLRDEIVGITKFCIHPKELFKEKTRIGGTKSIDLKKIELLNPDLIIGNKEENQQEQLEELMNKYPVWISDIKTLKEALDMIKEIGKLVDKTEKSEEIVKEIESRFQEFNNLKKVKISTAYFIWRKPFMTVGRDTFINSMLELCKFENVFGEELRYPEITEEILHKAAPEIILLSSEPYPFKEKHFEELKAICPNAKVILVDGEMFSWYGTRLLQAPDYFKSLLKTIYAY